jgi:MYXO-CTERM domain-containing protein
LSTYLPADDNRRMRSSLLALLLGVALPASAQHIVPAPGEAGHEPELLTRAESWARVQHGVLSLPVGFGLEAFVSRPEARTAIESYAAVGGDFRAVTGSHPYELVDFYEEAGDLGMFGGVQAAGDAFRYMVLRDSGAPAAEIDQARAQLLRVMDGLHWQTQITGEPGVLARGIMRITPEAGEPPVPGEVPELVPLFAADGSPLPVEKTPTWRADNSGELPFLIWIDDCSKDQIDGYIFALGAVYDAVQGDPTFPLASVARLVADALEIGRRLIEQVPVSDTATADLVIMDADGRPTTFHDLSAEEITPGNVLSTATNGFNGVMGLGMLRTLYHITGDDRIGEFYYEQLWGERNYLRPLDRTLRAMYFGTMTNFSNVNMAFVAIWGLLRYETDPYLRGEIIRMLHEDLYAPEVSREARGLGMPFFDFMYAAFHGVTSTEGQRALAEGMTTMRGYADGPVWNPEIINCDAAEIASRSCIGVDGTVLTISETLGRGDAIVAEDPVPITIRPPSNFEHRSDPHRVNGGGGNRLNPAGDMYTTYWMGRLLRATDDPDANLSPHARPPLPWMTSPQTDGGTTLDGGMEGPSGGCGCRTSQGRGASLGLVTAAIVAGWRRRRRR